MKLEIKNGGNLRSLFPREAEPDYTEDKVQYYNIKKLMEWEKSYNEIMKLLDGAEHQEGMRLLFELAEEGYPEARFQLSEMYLTGQGLPESFSKAIEWERRAKYAEGYFRDDRNHIKK